MWEITPEWSKCAEWQRQREAGKKRGGRGAERERDFYFEELANIIVGSGKSKIYNIQTDVWPNNWVP